MSDIDAHSFKTLSETKTEDGDTLIRWNVVEFVTTELTVGAPHRFERKGILILRNDGSNELFYWLSA